MSFLSGERKLILDTLLGVCRALIDYILSLFFTDSVLNDFIMMHCVFMPNSQLCPALMAQYPFLREKSL